MTSSQELLPLQSIPLPQLNVLKDQLEKELDLFSASYTTLKTAQQKYHQGLLGLNELNSKNEGKEILVPLTASVYVPGALTRTDKVLVDIGTGYYVNKMVPDAQKYYNQKIEFLKDELDKIQQTLYTKQDALLAIVNETQLRIAQQGQV